MLVTHYGAPSPWRSNDRQRRVWSSGSSAPVQRSDGCPWTPVQLRRPPLETAPPGSDSYRNHQLKSSPAEDLTETQREGCEFRTENTKHNSWTTGMETTGFITITIELYRNGPPKKYNCCHHLEQGSPTDDLWSKSGPQDASMQTVKAFDNEINKCQTQISNRIKFISSTSRPAQ